MTLFFCLVLYFNSIKVQLEPVSDTESYPLNVFQFHKGTIRTYHANCTSTSLWHFNSIKVQLELANINAKMAELHYFNSIKVQLEHSTYHDYNHFALFQFHKGTIRTADNKVLTVDYCTFQFHKGTIRTSIYKII